MQEHLILVYTSTNECSNLVRSWICSHFFLLKVLSFKRDYYVDIPIMHFSWTLHVAVRSDNSERVLRYLSINRLPLYTFIQVVPLNGRHDAFTAYLKSH